MRLSGFRDGVRAPKARGGASSPTCVRAWALMPALAAASVARAEPAQADKSQYHLFNPTPRELMRELGADRPDTTESPYTVDAGHAQLEMSFVDFTYDDEDDVRTRAVSIAPLNLKLGLLNNVDVQFVLDPYVEIDIDDGADETLDGFGDAQLRLKVNLWGNDGGRTVFAVMPFVKFPTGDDDLTNEHVEGGVIFPLAIELPADFSLGLMAEFDVVYDDADDNYDVDLVHTATVGHDLVGKLAGYVEYVGIAQLHDDADYLALLGAGLTYALSDDVQLDAGVNFGLTDEADDFNVFAGITVRL
jgi:hypothetical protein